MTNPLSPQTLFDRAKRMQQDFASRATRTRSLMQCEQYQACADLLQALTDRITALEQQLELEEVKSGTRGNMLRYISFVVSGREDSDVQLEVDRLVAKVTALEDERDELSAKLYLRHE